MSRAVWRDTDGSFENRRRTDVRTADDEYEYDDEDEFNSPRYRLRRPRSSQM